MGPGQPSQATTLTVFTKIDEYRPHDNWQQRHRLLLCESRSAGQVGQLLPAATSANRSLIGQQSSIVRHANVL